PPQPAESAIARKSMGAVTAIRLSFSVPLDPASARSPGLYAVLGGVKQKGTPVFHKPLSIKTVRYNATTHTVTLTLARPFMGAVQVTVRAGLKRPMEH